MKVLLTPIGSHGDVHPFVGLGVELARRGHAVSVIANPHFQSVIDRAGLTFIPFGSAEEFRAVIHNPVICEPIEGFKLLMRYMATAVRPLYELIAAHHVPGETVVVHSPLGLGARLAHEKLGVPLATVHLAPSSLRSAQGPLVLPAVRVPGWAPAFLKRLVYWWGDRFVVGPLVDAELNGYRAELGLGPLREPAAVWWNSPRRILALFPDWFAPPPADWPTQVRMCGFPLFDERGIVELPSELERFLQAGDPPLIFTPGSANVHAHAFFQAALEACQALGRRGILLTMHPAQLPPRLPEGIRHFTYIPFSQVFPRAAAIVHHGGVGTLAQGLAAGVPQLIMPMGYDQPDNAERLERLGVGAALRVRRFTGRNVAAKLRGLLQPEVRTRCLELAHRLKDGRPLERACDLVEEMLTPTPATMSR